MHVSIITVNYNSSEHTINMVNSIRTRTMPGLTYEIIIVDNASESDQYELLLPLESFPEVKIIRSRLNGGFAFGNMMGIQHALGAYYLLLNNDTLFQNDVLHLFYQYAQNNSDTGLLTGQLFHEDGTRSSSYKKFPSLANKLFGNSLVRFFNPNDFPSNKAIFNQPTEVGVVSGSCMFFRRTVFDALGGLDTIFFLYCEEEDISKRIRDYGSKVFFLPDARITHIEGASTGRNLAIEKEFFISYKLLLEKHLPIWQSSIIKFLQLFKLLRRSFRSRHYFQLFLFLLRGAPLKESLRYKQRLK
ncbi:MAG: glycosyltransferase family 2 protein [Sulfuricurvum sp.]|nr:glycosyltransferase family 2 protein [Sulfuricurvum sp.]